MKRKYALFALIAAFALMLAGCSGGESAQERGFTVAVLDTYIDSAKVEAYGASLERETPAAFTALSMGDSQNDPMSAVAGAAAFTTQVASGEIDVVIAPPQVVAASARSETFMPLTELFSPEELAAIDDALWIDYELYDENLAPTGERTPACGIDVSQDEGLQSVLGKQQIGVYVVVNTAYPDQARQMVLDYLG